MSVDGTKSLTKDGALEVLSAFTHLFATAEDGMLCLWADKLGNWLRAQHCISRTRLFRRGDRVNVLDYTHGSYLRRNCLVIEDENPAARWEQIKVAEHERLSIEEALKDDRYWTYPYFRLELVQHDDYCEHFTNILTTQTT